MTTDGGTERLEIGLELGSKKAFAWALDWPGWCRSGKDPDLAQAALLTAAPRYAVVTEAAGLVLPARIEVAVVETVTGDGGTDFGVPSKITDPDRRPVSAAEAERLAALVEAAWTVFDRVAAAAPEELRKGPRGGGRDRDKVIEHVDGADDAYARTMGVKVAAPDRAVAGTVEAMRAAVLEVLRRASDGSPIDGRKWPPRYAARRIAWHAIDHAWEIEDRTEP
jgi:hypothetical protein